MILSFIKSQDKMYHATEIHLNAYLEGTINGKQHMVKAISMYISYFAYHDCKEKRNS